METRRGKTANIHISWRRRNGGKERREEGEKRSS